jgi:hypothetical protein
MTDTSDWRCDRCGSNAVTHFLARDKQGERWWNRCKRCRRVSEYLPTRAEIERECRLIRAAQGHALLDDEQERRWRQNQVSGVSDQESVWHDPDF